jgi:hypothetical protein
MNGGLRDRIDVDEAPRTHLGALLRCPCLDQLAERGSSCSCCRDSEYQLRASAPSARVRPSNRAEPADTHLLASTQLSLLDSLRRHPSPSKMPTDLRTRRSRSTTFPLTPFQLALIFTLALFYSFASLHYSLPPYSWIDNYKHRHDKVVKHRPAFKKIERCVGRGRRGRRRS